MREVVGSAVGATVERQMKVAPPRERKKASIGRDMKSTR